MRKTGLVDFIVTKSISRFSRNTLDCLELVRHLLDIKSFHSGVSRMLRNPHYLGDDYYPAIIDLETFDKAEAERLRRAEYLGRIREQQGQEKIAVPVSFHASPMEQKYDDPFQQAEYAYSLIESEG